MKTYQHKTVLITRPASQAAQTVAEFEAQGATVISIPLIEIVDPVDKYASLDSALANLNEYDWIIFTSQNAVLRFFSRPLAPAGEALQQRVAAVGPKTEQLLRELNVSKVEVASEASAQGLLAHLQNFDFAEKRVLFPRAREGKDTLIEGLKRCGANIVYVEAYQTILPRDFNAAELIKLIKADKIDAVHFASPSAVKNFKQILKFAKLSADKIELICQGETTASSAW